MNARSDTRRIILYLDQFIWVQLLQASRDQDATAAEVKHLLLRLRERQLVCVPLSGTHYLETWHRRDPASREDLAALMRDVSRYDTIAPVQVSQRWGVAEALAKLAYAPRPIRPTILGHGVNHAFESPIGRFRPVEWLASDEREEGPAVALEHFAGSRSAAEALLRLAAARHPEWEWLNLAGNPELFERFPEGLDRTPEHRYGTSAMLREAALRERFRSENASRITMESVLVADEMVRMLDDVNASAKRHKFDLQGWLVRYGPDGIRQLVEAVPTSDVLFRLRHHLHRNTQHPIDQHDRTDLQMLANVIPNCDVVVTEKRWAHAARQTRLANHYNTIMLATLGEVRTLLARIESGSLTRDQLFG